MKVVIMFVPINVFYVNHMFLVLFILQRISIRYIYIYYLNNVSGISAYCALLDRESLIHVNFIPTFVVSYSC